MRMLIPVFFCHNETPYSCKILLMPVLFVKQKIIKP